MEHPRVLKFWIPSTRASYKIVQYTYLCLTIRGSFNRGYSAGCLTKSPKMKKNLRRLCQGRRRLISVEFSPECVATTWLTQQHQNPTR